MNKMKKDKGITLLISMIVTGTLLLVAMSLTNLATRQLVLSSTARESQFAFYAADTGVECALYWDVKNPSGETAFSNTPGTIQCNNESHSVGGGSVSNFTMHFSPEPYCARVTVTKMGDGTTKIESRGYNTCDTSSPRRLERAIQATY